MSFDMSGGLRSRDEKPRLGAVRYVLSRLGWQLLFVMLFITAVAFAVYTIRPGIVIN